MNALPYLTVITRGKEKRVMHINLHLSILADQWSPYIQHIWLLAQQFSPVFLHKRQIKGLVSEYSKHWEIYAKWTDSDSPNVTRIEIKRARWKA